MAARDRRRLGLLGRALLGSVSLGALDRSGVCEPPAVDDPPVPAKPTPPSHFIGVDQQARRPAEDRHYV